MIRKLNAQIGSPLGGKGAIMMTMGRLRPTTDDERVDYGPLLGYSQQQVRVDPHTHVITTKSETSLREIADLIRPKEEPKERER